MRNFRKAAALAVALATAFSAVGCSDKSSKNEESGKETSTAAAVTAAPVTSTQAVTTTVTTTATTTVTTTTTAPQTEPSDEDGKTGGGGTLKEALAGKEIGDISVLVENMWAMDDIVGFYEANGGKVNIEHTNAGDFYDQLALKVILDEAPDLTYCGFKPVSVKKGLYAPMDGFVDFDSDRWKGIKDVAKAYVFDGSQYAVPFRSNPTCFVCYDLEKIYENGFDDPYGLWKDGDWNMDVMIEMMKEYKASSGAKTAVNGYIVEGFTGSNGTGLFINKGNGVAFNGRDEKLMSVMERIEELDRDGLIDSTWSGTADDSFFYGNLFYIMGDWAFSGVYSPKADDNWGIVPVPSMDGSKCVGCSPSCLSAVIGSKNSAHIPAFLECARETVINKSCIQEEQSKFAEENPYWTEEMLEVREEVMTNSYKKVVEQYWQMTFDSDKEDIGNVCSFWYDHYDSWSDVLKNYGKDLEAGV